MYAAKYRTTTKRIGVHFATLALSRADVNFQRLRTLSFGIRNATPLDIATG